MSIYPFLTMYVNTSNFEIAFACGETLLKESLNELSGQFKEKYPFYVQSACLSNEVSSFNANSATSFIHQLRTLMHKLKQFEHIKPGRSSYRYGKRKAFNLTNLQFKIKICQTAKSSIPSNQQNLNAISKCLLVVNFFLVELKRFKLEPLLKLCKNNASKLIDIYMGAMIPRTVHYRISPPKSVLE